MDERKEYVMKAFKTVLNNSYLRCLFGNEQLFYMFMEGMKFAKTDEIPKDLLDDDDFVSTPEKYRKNNTKK